MLNNVHPGDVLLEDFLKPLGISQYRLATSTDLSQSTISRICGRTQPVTADVALRLSRFFGTTAKFWLNLQAAYDIEEEQKAHKSYSKIPHYASLMAN